jgi:DNA-binding transcriptional regulator LsrR (DeoR family)
MKLISRGAMNTLHDVKYVLEVCEMFYIKGKSQKEISAILNISRPQVSRIISKAKEDKLVSIKLNYPNNEENEFQNIISNKYHIPEVYVYDIGQVDSDEGMQLLAEASKDLFKAIVKTNQTVGIMAGRTVEILSEKIEQTKNRGLTFIPLCGGMTSNGRTWQANNICQQFAQKTNGKFYLLNSPNYFKQEATKNAMLSEDSIKEVMKMGTNCDVALLGIGNLTFQSTGIMASGLSKEEVQVLKDEGAIANICCSYINKDGKVIDTSITNKILGHSIADLRKSKKMAIAMGDDKLEAIKAVLKGELVDVFITSLDTAKKIVG